MNGGNYPSNDSSDSLTILQKIAKGDPNAVNECLDKYAGIIWSLARKHTETDADAEDAAQEIFIDIWRNAARFDISKARERVFIELIARRRLIDRLRIASRRPRTSSIEEISIEKTNGEYEKLQLHLEVNSALSLLNKLRIKQKQIIVMALFNGMSHTEIADSIGLPVGTIKSNIRRGLQIIRNEVMFTNLHSQIDFQHSRDIF